MKSEHRHELKTNELAEWLANLPKWAKENRTTIIVVVGVIIIVAAFYFWRFYTKNVVLVREQLELTSLISEISQGKSQVFQAHSQGRDLSFILLQPAENLKSFAQNAKDSSMSALALIKRGETLRAELHFRSGDVSKEILIDQINRAKASYNEALSITQNRLLIANAKFGLGLCEEELGNFDSAQQIYREIAETPDFDGTAAKAAAEHRLEIMEDYKENIVFALAPEPKPIVTSEQPIEMKSAEVNLPVETNAPIDISLGTERPTIVPEVPDTNLEPEIQDSNSDVVETNLPSD